MNIKDFIFWITIAVALFSFVYVIYFLNSEGGKCFSNPIVFVEKRYDNKLSCYCYYDGTPVVFDYEKGLSFQPINIKE